MISRLSLVLCGLLLGLCPVLSLAEDAPLRIKAEEARQYADKRVEVQFQVKASKYSAKRKTAFLDSEQNFQDEKNLGIAITEKGIQDLKQTRAVDGPADYYRDKMIRVTGTVVIREDKPYIEVNEARQLDLVPQ